MKHSKTELLAATRLAGIGLALATITAPALSAPTQVPLLSRDGWEGKPNVVFTLDDSGSMDWSFMPDSVYNSYPAGGTYNTGFDPSESAQVPFARNRFISTRTGDMTVAAWRSNQINKVYYDPNIRYVPWANSDGSLWPDSVPTAALVSPQAGTPTTVDLTTNGNVTARWCDSENCNTKTIDYSPATYFQYNGGAVNDPANYTRVRIMDSAAYVRPATRIDCNVDLIDPNIRACTQAQEMVNFANWFTYYRRRMSLAIGASSQAFAQQGNGLRVGYGRINKGYGTVDGQGVGTVVRGVRDFSGQDRLDFFDWLHNSIGNGGTPLRYAMGEVGKYFQRSDNRGPWGEDPGTNDSTAHLECRKSYHILMSDGYWNGSQASESGARQNVDNQTGPNITGPGGQQFQYTPTNPYRDNTGNTLADVAMYYWNRDLRPDLANRVRPDSENPAFWQNLVQFTVGLGVGGALDPETDLPNLIDGSQSWTSVGTLEGLVDDLWHAAVNSHGQYLSASDPEQFAVALSAILQSISERESAEGGSAVSSITLETSSRKFIPTYQTAGWSGDVQAKQLDINGVAVADLWRASENLPAPANRNLFIGSGGSATAKPFTWASMSTAQKTLMGPQGSTGLVNFLRGDRSGEGSTYRERNAESVLGDMVNSTPLLIGGLLDEHYQFLPGSVAGAGSYRAFINQKKARDRLLFIGANDGMLHAFRDADGVEAFGFVPNTVIPNLFELAQPSYSHRFYVDGPLTEADAFVGGSWKNYVMGSLGGGGRAIFAIDTTDTNNLGANNIKWEFTHNELGYVMAPISVGVGQNGRWHAYVGNGFESNSGLAQLFVIDLETRAVVKRISTGVGGGNGLGGVRLVKDRNNVVVAAYAGDLKGNMWRFDMNDSTPGVWSVGFGSNPLYVATAPDGTRQAITAQPDYVDHPDGGQLVVFGTGRLFADSDLISSAEHSLYGVWDKTLGMVDSADGEQFQPTDNLVEQTFGSGTTSAGTDFYASSTTPIDYTTDRGWKLRLTLEAGQRSIYTPQFVRGFFLFGTVAPTGGTGLPCDDSRSTGYNILVNALSGASPAKPIFDTTGDGKIDENDSLQSSYKTVADGKDTLMLGKNGKVVIQRAFGETTVRLEGRALERTWRQLLNYPR
ncbi:MAG: pilus assembly protein [Burkholderiaceae bacterium]